MAEPKKKKSRSRRDQGRKTHKAKKAQLVICKRCGKKTLPHHVCKACGEYNK